MNEELIEFEDDFRMGLPLQVLEVVKDEGVDFCMVISHRDIDEVGDAIDVYMGGEAYISPYLILGMLEGAKSTVRRMLCDTGATPDTEEI